MGRRQTVVVAPTYIVNSHIIAVRGDERRASGRDGHTVSAKERPRRCEIDPGVEFMVHGGVDDVPPVELCGEPLAFVDAAVTEDSLRFGEGVRQGAGGLADNFAGIEFQSVGSSLSHRDVVLPIDGR